MTRAAQFAERALEIQGGASEPVYLVKSIVTGEDQSRGVRGIEQLNEIELIPRPMASPVSGALVTRANSVLKIGDILIEVSGSQVTERDLNDIHTRFRIGNTPNGDLLNIVSYERNDLGGDVMLYRVFCRGGSNI